MLLDFETFFLNSTNIMDSVYRGWVGGRGVDGKPKAGYTIHWNGNRVVVSLTKHRDSNSPRVRRRRSWAAV